MEEKRDDLVKDIVDAKNIALNHLMMQGKVVLGRDIVSIFKLGSVWFVIIEDKIFNGVVIIKSTTAEVISLITLD